MKEQKNNSSGSRTPKAKTCESAFDIWLQRGLHKLFDDVANEPIPEELLRLIEEDRTKSSDPPNHPR
jgi:hypothetical protein